MQTKRTGRHFVHTQKRRNPQTGKTLEQQYAEFFLAPNPLPVMPITPPGTGMRPSPYPIQHSRTFSTSFTTNAKDSPNDYYA